MTTLELTLNLSDELAQKAQARGLLSSAGVARLIEEAIERQAGAALLDSMRRLQAANAPPLTEADIAAEVKAVRADRRNA